MAKGTFKGLSDLNFEDLKPLLSSMRNKTFAISICATLQISVPQKEKARQAYKFHAAAAAPERNDIRFPQTSLDQAETKLKSSRNEGGVIV